VGNGGEGVIFGATITVTDNPPLLFEDSCIGNMYFHVFVFLPFDSSLNFSNNSQRHILNSHRVFQAFQNQY
jgi:hypothetical protein